MTINSRFIPNGYDFKKNQILFIISLLNSCYITLSNNVQHCGCWADTVKLELLKSTVKKDC